MLAASCGDDKKSDSTTATTASTPATSASTATSGSTTDSSTATSGASTDSTSAGKDIKLDKTVVMTGLISDPGGNDKNAVPDMNDGIRLAVKEINAAGGVGGQQLSYETFETPPTGDAVINSFNLAVGKNPDVILGPSSSATVLAIAKMADEAKIPLIHTATEPKVAHDAEAGSKYIFSNRPSNAGEAAAAATYTVKTLGKKKIGVMYVNSSFGLGGLAAIKAAVTAAGGEVVKETAIEYNATDVTNNVLELKDVEAILNWGTPATVGLTVKTLAQQGLTDITHVGPGSIGFGFFTKLVGDDTLLEGMNGVVDCNVAGSSDPAAKKFVADYQAEYKGQTPSYASAEMYDTVYLYVDAIKRAGSVDKEAVTKALEETKDFKGVCTTYTQNNGILNHSADMVKFEKGKLVTLETVKASD
ncbi:MAG TPA: ABC transporter substrate-binding protein [Ilumatobacteraceae bacterium]|nr:ABC transporter substrate-binding protein [Ilumatobacteraceae bacterium]